MKLMRQLPYQLREQAFRLLLTEGLFEDVSRLLDHTHHEDPFDDFARQPTLPKRLSQLGPGICWCDLNNDGWDDLVIAGGKGGSLAVFLNDGKGGFKRSQSAAPDAALTRDQTAVIAWPQTSGSPSVLVGSANYEDASNEGASVLQYDLNSGAIDQAVPAVEASVGALAVSDLDGDGNLDLFVGGRVLPGKYPEAASSLIFRGNAGKFELDAVNTKVLDHVGLVSSAIWSDLDGDGFPELILACEWGPIRIFHNDHAGWRRLIRNWSLPRFTVSNSTLLTLSGWWNGVTTGDLDGDGRLDIVASNWGQNSKYQSHRAAPLRLYFADFLGEEFPGLLELTSIRR